MCDFFRRAFLRGLCCLALLPLPALAEGPVIAAFGDSLSAGYDLPVEDGFAPQLQAALAEQGIAATVLNAAVSGDTSADGRRRVAWMLRKKPDLVIVALGANDMLRAMPTAQLYQNLNDIIARIKESGAAVLLAGMLAADNLGEEYKTEFAAVYQRLADEHQVALYPFFLKDVATVEHLNLADGLHPNREGVATIVANILPFVVRALPQ